MDLSRFQRVLPLKSARYLPYGPYSAKASAQDAANADRLERSEAKRGIIRSRGKVDPESLFEENAHEQGLEIVHMASGELGIEKAIIRG